jgi:hypothetical protein
VPCDHLQPNDVIEKAETWLRERGIPRERWAGTTVRHGENTPGGMWASVVIEVTHREGEWIVTRLDRNREPLASDEVGLSVPSS